MPITPTYPGVYVEEISSGVRTIVGVATSITAFIGRALRGPVNEPTRVQNFGEFARVFGGLWIPSTMSYAVHHYFLNGGSDAIIVRVHNGAVKATLELPAGSAKLTLEASSEGEWGNTLQAIVDHETRDKNDSKLFNLTIEEAAAGVVVRSETLRNVSIDASAPRFITRVLEQESALVRVTTGSALPASRPDANTADPVTKKIKATAAKADGKDGSAVAHDQISNASTLEADKKGLWALEKADLFNLLCIPPLSRTEDIVQPTRDEALRYCKRRRAIFMVDAPGAWKSRDDAEKGIATFGLADENAVIYFPRVKMADPLNENHIEEFAPCGAVAGVFARTDAQRGVWKAPAGLDATLPGVRDLAVKLTDGENGQLNPLGVNCLRTFPIIGSVIWGARTMKGADRLASEWKYVPVRRTSLFIAESLYRGTAWVTFEPNDEPLWAQIRLNVGAFMQNLFRQGAFAGTSAREAYFVKCDKETTTQNDVNLGIVNIAVGFAPLKPAEFVIIKIQQMAGQVQT